MGTLFYATSVASNIPSACLIYVPVFPNIRENRTKTASTIHEEIRAFQHASR